MLFATMQVDQAFLSRSSFLQFCDFAVLLNQLTPLAFQVMNVKFKVKPLDTPVTSTCVMGKTQ